MNVICILLMSTSPNILLRRYQIACLLNDFQAYIFQLLDVPSLGQLLPSLVGQRLHCLGPRSFLGPIIVPLEAFAPIEDEGSRV